MVGSSTSRDSPLKQPEPELYHRGWVASQKSIEEYLLMEQQKGSLGKKQCKGEVAAGQSTNLGI